MRRALKLRAQQLVAMAFFEATPEIAKLDVIEGEPRSVCGTYELHTLTGKAGGPSYYCKAVQLYLYERAPGSWCVGRKSGGKHLDWQRSQPGCGKCAIM